MLEVRTDRRTEGGIHRKHGSIDSFGKADSDNICIFIGSAKSQGNED